MILVATLLSFFFLTFILLGTTAARMNLNAFRCLVLGLSAVGFFLALFVEVRFALDLLLLDLLALTSTRLTFMACATTAAAIRTQTKAFFTVFCSNSSVHTQCDEVPPSLTSADCCSESAPVVSEFFFYFY